MEGLLARRFGGGGGGGGGEGTDDAGKPEDEEKVGGGAGGGGAGDEAALLKVPNVKFDSDVEEAGGAGADATLWDDAEVMSGSGGGGGGGAGADAAFLDDAEATFDSNGGGGAIGGNGGACDVGMGGAVEGIDGREVELSFSYRLSVDEVLSIIPRIDRLALISAKKGNPPGGTSEDDLAGVLTVGLKFLESELNAGTGGGGGACGACEGLIADNGKTPDGKGGATSMGGEKLELFL